MAFTISELSNSEFVTQNNLEKKNLQWLQDLLKPVILDEEALKKHENSLLRIVISKNISEARKLKEFESAPEQHFFYSLEKALVYIREHEMKSERMVVVVFTDGEYDETKKKLIVDRANTFFFSHSLFKADSDPSSVNLMVSRSFMLASTPSGMKGLTLSRVGEKSDGVHIAGASAVLDSVVVKSGVSIKGFSNEYFPIITNSTLCGNSLGSGCFILGSPKVLFENCKFNNNGFNGMMLIAKGATVQVSNCQFVDNGRNGINSEECLSLNISNSVSKGNKKRGMKVANTGSTIIKDSKSQNNSANGLYISYSNNVTLENFESSENGASGIHSDEMVSSLTISNTTSSKNKGTGLFIGSSSEGMPKNQLDVSHSSFCENEWDGVAILKNVIAKLSNITCNNNGKYGLSDESDADIKDLESTGNKADEED